MIVSLFKKYRRKIIVARNICLDCGYFLNCKRADEKIIGCDQYIKAHRTITKIEKGDVENGTEIIKRN